MLAWKKDASPAAALPRLKAAAAIIEQLPASVTSEAAKAALWPLAEAEGKGEVLWPLRVALTGKERSPDPFTIIHIIGPHEALRRVEYACAILEQYAS